jgi:hypothetical protein
MDLPNVIPWQQKVIKDLQDREQSLQETLFDSAAELAKEYTCLAYDWYSLGITSEGQRLVNQAEIIVPGYYNKECRQQMADSPAFAHTMNSISTLLMDLATKPQE